MMRTLFLQANLSFLHECKRPLRLPLEVLKGYLRNLRERGPTRTITHSRFKSRHRVIFNAYEAPSRKTQDVLKGVSVRIQLTEWLLRLIILENHHTPVLGVGTV